MAVNPNVRLANGHCLIVGTTGSGKSTLLKGLEFWKKRQRRIWLYDPSAEHVEDVGAVSTSSWAQFIQLARELENSTARTKRPIAYCPLVPDAADFDNWCRAVWAVADGKRPMVAVAEELSAVTETAGKASRHAAILLNQGRKYGVSFIGTVQRPQEVSKTIFDACATRYIGRQKGKAMQRRMAEELGLSVAEVAALQELQFYADGSHGEPRLMTAKPKKKSA